MSSTEVDSFVNQRVYPTGTGLSPLIEESTTFQTDDQNLVPPVENTGSKLALEAYNMCDYRENLDKGKCQSAFKLYEDSLKIVDGSGTGAGNRADLPINSPELLPVMQKIAELRHGSEVALKFRDNEVREGHVKAQSSEDIKNTQTADHLSDERSNITGIRLAYALALSEYGKTFHDEDMQVKAKNLVEQGLTLDPDARNRMLLKAAKADLDRDGSIDPAAITAESKVLRAAEILNFPHLLGSAEYADIIDASTMVGNAKIDNYAATQRELERQTPFFSWDKAVWRTVQERSEQFYQNLKSEE
ncbi:MAG: hypothetical protein K2X81_25175 [Candidatus Obscuribacterales bacterium]|nr:hypothetical protein [Candidatus Obscuribacterales bacterium]